MQATKIPKNKFKLKAQESKETATRKWNLKEGFGLTIQES